MTRVVEDLNSALHTLLDRDPRIYVLGEDIADPYGGAFKVTRGLSTRFPGRTITAPISEAGITGVAGGLALCGNRPIVEVMFADFLAQTFDQLLNFASKSVSMYGRTVPMHLVVRCASGGRRGYGATHSQSPQKHFIGIPHLQVYEMSPFHDNLSTFTRMLDAGEPCVFFEDKTLYGRRTQHDRRVDDLFEVRLIDHNHAQVYIDEPHIADVVVIAAGGLADRAMTAARSVFLESERYSQVIVPSRLYPFDPEPLLPLLRRAGRVCVAEEGPAGGGWGAEVARVLHERIWPDLVHPVVAVTSAAEVIPAAKHLERQVLIQDTDIRAAIEKVLDA